MIILEEKAEKLSEARDTIEEIIVDYEDVLNKKTLTALDEAQTYITDQIFKIKRGLV